MTVVEHPIEFFGVDALQDPHPLYDRLRAGGPVHRIGESGFYVVCTWEAINDAINRPDDFSSNLTATMMFTAEGTVVPFELDGLGGPTQILATADDPAHVEHRKMLVPQLAAKRIRAMEPFIADTFDRLWADGLRGGHRTRCAAGRGTHDRAAARLVPVRRLPACVDRFRGSRRSHVCPLDRKCGHADPRRGEAD